MGSVQAGSPAEKAGLQGVTQNDFSNTQTVGDIITGIDGHPVRSIDDLISYIDSHKSIGDNVGLTVNRHGQIMNSNLVPTGTTTITRERHAATRINSSLRRFPHLKVI